MTASTVHMSFVSLIDDLPAFLGLTSFPLALVTTILPPLLCSSHVSPSTMPLPCLGNANALLTWLPFSDYYQRVYPRAFKKGIELARKCEGLRHIIAISSPGHISFRSWPP